MSTPSSRSSSEDRAGIPTIDGKKHARKWFPGFLNQAIEQSHGLQAVIVARNYETDTAHVLLIDHLTQSGLVLLEPPSMFARTMVGLLMSVNMQKATMVLHTFEITLVCSTCQKLKHPQTVAVGTHFFPKAFSMLGFSFSLLCRRGSDTEATTGWTDGKPWEIAWGELRWEGAMEACMNMVDGQETVGNSLGRAPMIGSDRQDGRTGNHGK